MPSKIPDEILITSSRGLKIFKKPLRV